MSNPSSPVQTPASGQGTVAEESLAFAMDYHRIMRNIHMTYLEFKRHLGKADLSICEFAEPPSVRPGPISNHSKKSAVPTPHAVIAGLLGDAADRGINPMKLLGRYGVFPTSPSPATSLDDFRGRRIGQQS